MKALFDHLVNAVVFHAKARVHQALGVPAAEVFETYFKWLPPFDGEGSKEFPDGFVLHVLEKWCAAESVNLYVVSADGAIGRAAEKSSCLISLKSLHEILRFAASSGGNEVEDAAEAIIANLKFERKIARKLKTAIKDATFVYTGDLPDGEAFDGDLVDLIEIRGWTVIGRAGSKIGLILKVEVTAIIEVQFEDHYEAMYDNGDGRWYGAGIRKTDLETEVDLPVYMRVDESNGKIVKFEVLDEDVYVSERCEDFK